MDNRPKHNGTLPPQRPSWEDLNAYVDGELTKQERARVAAAVAEDRALADQVALLSQFKAELAVSDAAHLGTHNAPNLEELLTKARREKDQRLGLPLWKKALGLVASISLVALIGYTLQGPQTRPPVWVTDYSQQHHKASQLDSLEPHLAIALATNHLKQEVHIPDLSAVGLTLVRTGLQPHSTGQSDTVQLLYRGPNGCRISLWITQALPADPAFFRYDIGEEKLIAWTIGDLRYALLSGMDPQRFDLIAKLAMDQVKNHFDRQEALTIAVNQARETAAPCLG